MSVTVPIAAPHMYFHIPRQNNIIHCNTSIKKIGSRIPVPLSGAQQILSSHLRHYLSTKRASKKKTNNSKE